MEENSKEKVLDKAVEIAKENVAIDRIIEKCVNCGFCKRNCIEREGIEDLCEGKACVNCGQCVQICPLGAMIPKNDTEKLKEAISSGKICIAYTSPAVRVAIGEAFGMEYGTFAQGKLVSCLRKLGFQYVFDVTSGADLTIIEESNELLERIKNNENLPMFTSCCPAWVKYAEQYYPELLENLSSCKSPIGMQGAIVKEYYIPQNKLENTFTVAITPCTAKKYEISRSEIEGTDLVITTKELIDLLKEKEIDFSALEDSQYDSLLGEGSGAGMIFGGTGGVMEAALRTAYNVATGEKFENTKIEFTEVRGMENVREATIDIGGNKINIAVIHKMSSAKPILEDVKNGNSKYHYIEIMNCYGGCIGGGGQPKLKLNQEVEVKEKRKEALYTRDKNVEIRQSHKNPDMIKLYNEFLGDPLGDKAMELLHTNYEDKSKNLNMKK